LLKHCVTKALKLKAAELLKEEHKKLHRWSHMDKYRLKGEAAGDNCSAPQHLCTR
jgi:hypothetical protein